MKKTIYLIFFLLSLSFAYAQAPQGINYQVVARDGDGNPITTGLTFTITIKSDGGSAVYTETHEVTPNTFGLCEMVIGDGTSSDNFAIIDWGGSVKSINISATDGSGNTINFGDQSFQSVPYALYAEKANGIEGFDVDTSGVQNGHILVYNSGSKTWKPQTLDGGNITYTAGSGIEIDNNKISAKDTSDTNELQNLKLDNDKLTLTNSSDTIDLGDYKELPNNATDKQILQYSEGSKTWEAVAPSANGGAQTLTFTPVTSILEISEGNTVDLSTLKELPNNATDKQILQYSEGLKTWEAVNLPTGISYTAGEGIKIDNSKISAIDKDSTNEVQDLKLENDQLTLTKSTGSVDLSSYKLPTGSSQNQVLRYDGNNWVADNDKFLNSVANGITQADTSLWNQSSSSPWENDGSDNLSYDKGNVSIDDSLFNADLASKQIGIGTRFPEATLHLTTGSILKIGKQRDNTKLFLESNKVKFYTPLRAVITNENSTGKLGINVKNSPIIDFDSENGLGELKMLKGYLTLEPITGLTGSLNKNARLYNDNGTLYWNGNPIVTGNTSPLWGDITGNITDNIQLNNALNSKFDKLDATISDDYILRYDDGTGLWSAVTYTPIPQIGDNQIYVGNTLNDAKAATVRGDMTMTDGEFTISDGKIAPKHLKLPTIPPSNNQHLLYDKDLKEWKVQDYLGGSSPWSTATNTIYTKTDNVGIGTESNDSQTKLHVSADKNIATGLKVENINESSLPAGYGIHSTMQHSSDKASFLFFGNYSSFTGAGSTYGISIANEKYNNFSGSVGIGKDEPNSPYKLDVNGPANVKELYIDGDKFNASGVASPWSTGTGTIYTTTGNVGIGTDDPQFSLDVEGIGIRSKSKSHQFVLHDTDSGADEWSISTFNNESLSISENAEDANARLVIKNGGNVGIGTDDPTEKLEVHGGTTVLKDANGSSSGGTPLRILTDDASTTEYGIDFGINATRFYIKGVGGTPAVHPFVLNHQTGDLGLGTNNPKAKLEINDGGIIIKNGGKHLLLHDSDSQKEWEVNTAYNGYSITEDPNNSTDAAIRFIIREGGNIGIGTKSPGRPLHVKVDNKAIPAAMFENGDAATTDGIVIQLGPTNPGNNNDYIVFRNAAGAAVGSVDGTGLGGVSYRVSSDRRLKENIIPVRDALELIANIKPSQYNYKSAPNKKDIGFIAQELQKVYPQAVSGDSTIAVEIEPMMVDYSKLTPLLTAGLQEQQQIIDSQLVEIEKLKKELAIKTSSIQKLEKESEKQQKEVKEQKAQLEEQASDLAEIKKFIGFDSEAKK
ncbi:MAG: hypothetical protein GY827_00435 [Cytophagales bacterium]|nr:hypothetical protein [Cytophagales bacterium]